MAWILSIILLCAMVIIVFLKLPCSATKRHFDNDINFYTNRAPQTNTTISEQDIRALPEPVQNHFLASGYIGKEKISVVKAYITSAPLKDGSGKAPMSVDYTLCSFADEPVRLAYIRTSLFGIPFEAYDSTQGGAGFMKGVFGKVFTLFNQRGAEMDQAQLLTYLGECFLLPASILAGYITWETIDYTHVKASISYKGIAGSGIFTFDERGFVQSFQTEQRARIGNDGSIDYPKWSFLYEDFRETDHIFSPAKLKTVWHDNECDLVYFEATDIKFVYTKSPQSIQN